MSYLSIDNLYKNQDILMFIECYAMEKIHGTSTHITYKDDQIHFFSGGCKHENFVSLFDQEELLKRFRDMGHPEITVFGEGYGGKMQGMSGTYGKDLKFIVFEVKIGHAWLNVPVAEKIATNLGLDFVYYVKISTTLDAIDAERDAESVQAIRNGMGTGHKREGIVLRPLIELRKNNGDRIIAKHKREDFSERKSRQDTKVVDSEKLAVLRRADEIAEEWVTPMRLQHVLDKLPQDINIESTGIVIKAMVDDVLRESKDEIVDSKDARKAISSKAAKLFKQHIQNKLKGE